MACPNAAARQLGGQDVSDSVERITRLIMDEFARQPLDDDVLLFDPVSGMVDGVLDVHAMAGKIAEAIEPALPLLLGEFYSAVELHGSLIEICGPP